MQTNFALVQNILLIEDLQSDISRVAHKLDELRAHGLSFQRCRSLSEGLSILKESNIEIILLDLSVSRQLSSLESLYEKTPWIPIIVLTDPEDAVTGVNSLNCGAQDYLSMATIDLHSLSRAMNFAISRKQTVELQGLLTAIVESSDDAIISKTLNGTISSWNRGAEQLYGYTPDEATGHSIEMIIPPNNQNEVQNIFAAIRRGESFRQKETIRLRKDGQPVCVSASMSPIKCNGSVRGATSVDRDISAQKRAQEILKETEERYRLLVTGVKDYAIFMLNPDGLVESWNEGARRLKGYEEEEIKGQHFSKFYSADDQKNGLPNEHLRNTINRVSFACQGWRVRKDGSQFFADVVITPIVAADGTVHGFTKVTRDITEQMLAQKEVAEIKMRLSLALDAAAIGVFDFDLVRNSAWRSLRHDEIFGHTALLPEWNFNIFLTYIVPEDKHAAREAFQLGLKEKSFRMQCRIIRANDQAVRWISVRAETFRNELGVPIRMMGTVADITDINEKQEHRRLLAIMEEREDFMATLTHDMKNPLIGANRLLEMLTEGNFGEIPEEQMEVLQCLREANSALLKLIADLMDVYRFEKDVNFLWKADCDLVNVISSCVSRVAPFAKLRAIEVKTQMPSAQSAQADSNKLERVVQNLLDNALKFAPTGGVIILRLLSLDAFNVIEIEDNGLGIEPEEHARLFQRFSQGTAGKRYSGGSGLGLYLCRQIVEAHGGTIECTSQPNSSTIFRIALPKAAQS